ncbi:MAG TPA: hypothetical protein VF540_13515 [Segetibacter sp.]|jgi:hypothetical protein
MINLDVAELRPNLDLEGKYVDFNLLRTTISVAQLVMHLDIYLSEPNKDGECRGFCAKCGKERSFSLNVTTNRFNCFSKGCALKGGGVIDFFGKLYGVSAKEAAHLLAYVFSIEPYTDRQEVNPNPKNQKTGRPVDQRNTDNSINENNREVVSRAEFDELTKKVERLTDILKALAPVCFLDEINGSKAAEALDKVKRLNKSDVT